MKRWLSVVAVTVSVCFALSGIVAAQKGGGAHGSTGSRSSKPVHVKTYTKKDGTQVQAHDRRSPESIGNDRPSLADLARATAAQRTAGTQPNREKAQAHSSVRPPPEGGRPDTSLASLSRSERARRGTAAAPVVTSGTPRASTGQIYTVTDPITGRTTFTNLAPSAARTTAPAGSSAAAVPRAAPRNPTSRQAGRISTLPAGAAAQAALLSSVKRTANGRIARSEAARHAFARQTGYPSGRPGYVIDHIKPLACGGADAPANMQWETIAQGKAKDKIERIGCR